MGQRQAAEPAIVRGRAERLRGGRHGRVDRLAVELRERRRPTRPAAVHHEDDPGLDGLALDAACAGPVQGDGRPGAYEQGGAFGGGEPVVDREQGGAGVPGLGQQVEPGGARRKRDGDQVALGRADVFEGRHIG